MKPCWLILIKTTNMQWIRFSIVLLWMMYNNFIYFLDWNHLLLQWTWTRSKKHHYSCIWNTYYYYGMHKFKTINKQCEFCPVCHTVHLHTAAWDFNYGNQSLFRGVSNYVESSQYTFRSGMVWLNSSISL